jgi:tRNA(Ile)-lysidine synthase TilS/MesJ
LSFAAPDPTGFDDACESYLMNCLKGEQCYCPIKPISVLDKGQIVRPAILYTKKELSENIPKEIKEYEYVDPLNSSTLSQRNWIRNKIIPTIEEKYKGLPKVVKKKILKYIEENYV